MWPNQTDKLLHSKGNNKKTIYWMGENSCKWCNRQNSAICSNMDGTRDSYTKWSKSERERKMYMILLISRL